MREEMETKMSQADEQYRADLLAQEKKFKMQAKKNKEEFRKLLNANGVNDQVLCLLHFFCLSIIFRWSDISYQEIASSE